MRHRFMRGALLATTALLAVTAVGRAQDLSGTGYRLPAASADPVGRVAARSMPLGGPGSAVIRAQGADDIGGLNPPLNSDPTIPIPTGATRDAGFYTSLEFVSLTQTRAIGNQIIAYRGFVDSLGRLTGIPGTYIGSGQTALTTDQFGRTTYTPGFNMEIGYKFENGVRIYANYMHLFDTHSRQSASLVPPYFRSSQDLADTYLVAGVFNFPPEFAGPQTKIAQDQLGLITILVPTQIGTTTSAGPNGTSITTPNVVPTPQRVPSNSVVMQVPTQIGTIVTRDANNNIISNVPNIVNVPVPNPPSPTDPNSTVGGNAYGIWNAATVMNIQLTQRYSQAALGTRIPLLQTEYSRVYGIAEGKFAWLFDRFQWYTASYDINGVVRPQDAAWYTNTLSQRMYGPVIGCGHEIFLANQFSLSCDLTGGLLLSVVKERVKYKLESPGNGGTLQPIASKRSYDTWQLVPNANASVNMWWYPVEGVQVRVGYQAMSYFNTTRMAEPVGYNYGAPDPRYDTQVFRILHGFNVGVGLFF